MVYRTTLPAISKRLPPASYLSQRTQSYRECYEAKLYLKTIQADINVQKKLGPALLEKAEKLCGSVRSARCKASATSASQP